MLYVLNATNNWNTSGEHKRVQTTSNKYATIRYLCTSDSGQRIYRDLGRFKERTTMSWGNQGSARWILGANTYAARLLEFEYERPLTAAYTPDS